ncbi:MAG: acyl-CoA dehydrogenase family protein [Terricaulis sp.]
MREVTELEELRASFRQVLDDIVAAGDIRRHVDAGAARCDALWGKAAELGWFALLTPEALGGLELGRAAAAVLYEELGRVTAPLPIVGALAVTDVVALYGSKAQGESWLPRLANGETATFGAGAVFANDAGLRFAKDKLSGEAQDLLNGAEAALLLAPVREGWALADTAGFAIERIELVDRTRSVANARIDGADASLLAENDAIARALRVHVSVAIACDSIGGAKAVLDLTVDYLKMREQFGKPIGSFQALKHRCAEHKVAIEAADALLAKAVQRWANEDADAELHTALVKALACDVYAAVATDAVQLHGGIGFTWEHACHLYLKRAKLNQALFGTSAAHRDAAARLLVA